MPTCVLVVFLTDQPGFAPVRKRSDPTWVPSRESGSCKDSKSFTVTSQPVAERQPCSARGLRPARQERGPFLVPQPSVTQSEEPTSASPVSTNGSAFPKCVSSAPAASR